MRISELAGAAGLSADTLRYYERIGLMQRPLRDGAGHRVYREGDVAWLSFVMRLRETGMTIADMRRYAALRAEGSATLSARRAMLSAHRDAVRSRVAALQVALDALDRKIDTYESMMNGAQDE